MSRAASAFAPLAIIAALSVLSISHSPQLLAASTKSLAISGAPATTATVGTAYAFTPSVTPASPSEHFSISNKPGWATFDSDTGRLNGTPSATGTFTNIRISVTAKGSSASLAPFSITVSSGSTSGTGSINTKPTISGSPPTSVNESNTYSFTPTAQDANNDPLTFSVQNRPSWASFNTSNGSLSGTPTSANVGTYSNIVISVSDGTASASLAPFSIAVNQTSNGSAQVIWTPPTQNTDGTAISNLAGYRINYGLSQSNLDKTIQIANPGVASYVVTNLSAGTWYFDVVAYTSTGTQSAASNLASKTVQ